jgi:hypothetical protein
VLVALDFFGVVDDGSSLFLSMSTLLVEALPSLLTITLLIQYHITAAAWKLHVALHLAILARRC